MNTEKNVKNKTTKTSKSSISTKLDRIIDFLKTVLIYALTISMLTVAGLYIDARQNAGQPPEIPLEKRRVIESGGTIPNAEPDENQVNPVQITVTVENNSITAIYNDTLISKVYDEFKLTVSALFNTSSECRILDKTEGEKLWEKCVNKENSIYIRYAGDYVYPVIYAFLDKIRSARYSYNSYSSNNSNNSENTLAKVHELFITDEYPVYGVAKDEDGNISVFLPSSFSIETVINNQINTDYLQSAYNNSVAGSIPCKFLRDGDITAETGNNRNNIKNLTFSGDFHLFYTYNMSPWVLIYSNPLLLYENNKTDSTDTTSSANNINNINNIDISKIYIKNLFKILNFNAESAIPYSNSGSSTFTDGQSTVKFFIDGQITYTSKPDIYNISGGGVHLSRFLGYDSDDYTFYEKLKAASVFIRGLDRELAGFDGNLYLKDIKSDKNQNLNITFGYYYKGIEIKMNGYDYGVSVKINKDSVTDVVINSLYVTSEKITKNINPIMVLNEIDGMISKDLDDLENSANLEDSEKLRAKEEIAGKYKIKYDKNQDKFIVNQIELIYNINNINYTDYINYPDGGNSVSATWAVK